MDLPAPLASGPCFLTLYRILVRSRSKAGKMNESIQTGTRHVQERHGQRPDRLTDFILIQFECVRDDPIGCSALLLVFPEKEIHTRQDP